MNLAVRYNISNKTRYITRIAILAGLIIIMAFTPLGYLRIGVISISFLSLPVAIGGILLGPKGGAILGGVFGLTSFIQCFGLDAFGVMLMGINPVGTFIMCVVARVMMGWCSAMLFKLLRNVKPGIIAYMVSSVSAALLNTAFFVGMLLLFFGGNSEVQAAMGVERVIDFLPILLTFNALIEAAVCLVAGTTIAKLLSAALPELKPED